VCEEVIEDRTQFVQLGERIPDFVEGQLPHVP
jgi:hypothetical protein